MIPIRDRLPTRTVPFVTYGLIGLNVLSFLWELACMEAGYAEFVRDWGFVPARFLHAPFDDTITVFTSMFLHGGWMHIGGNMLFLWIFGDNVEDALGHVRYVAFYLACGVLAAGGQMMVDPASHVPMVGASGAIAGVLAAYVSLYPRARVLVLVPIFIFASFFEFPAWLVILEWFALQLFSGLGALAVPTAHSGVAFFAHIGGFVAGLLLVRLLMLGRETLSYEPWRGWRVTARRRAGALGATARRGPGWDA
jgi:membrane associated rhomboid family serine protease